LGSLLHTPFYQLLTPFLAVSLATEDFNPMLKPAFSTASMPLNASMKR
jgi:hypothetical protein